MSFHNVKAKGNSNLIPNAESSSYERLNYGKSALLQILYDTNILQNFAVIMITSAHRRSYGGKTDINAKVAIFKSEDLKIDVSIKSVKVQKVSMIQYFLH